MARAPSVGQPHYFPDSPAWRRKGKQEGRGERGRGGRGGEGSGREGGGRQARLSEDLASWDPFPQRSSLPRLLVGQRALMQEV